MNNKIIIFTKPWKNLSLEQLATLVKNMGFDGVELAIRDGYQVTPDNVLTELPQAKKIFESKGLFIGSVAGPLEENIISAMGKAKIPVLRTMAFINLEKGYFESLNETKNKIKGLSPLLKKNHVKIGIQNHHGYMINNAIGTWQFLQELDPTISGSVLDFAHCALAGEPNDMALDILKGQILEINFKAGYKYKDNKGNWLVHWTTGDEGLYSWETATKLLKEHKFMGNICLHAEYNKINSLVPLVGEEAQELAVKDLNYLKSFLMI